jgi:bacillithiol biosynthesis cysteine-adding enzyme BshC
VTGGSALRPAVDGVQLRVGALRGGGALVRDYLAGRDLSAFFTGHSSDPAAYARKAAEVDARMDAAARMRAAPAIEPLGDSAQRLTRILAGDGYFITTGQQPALFGGPLYTLYKILGAIRLAELQEQRLGRPVLALFWIGSDDHDWDEANHTALLDAERYVRRITVRGAADAPPHPLYRRAWGDDIEAASAELATLLPDTVHARAVLDHVRASYSPNATVSASFTATLKWLLNGQRVAFVDSAHPSVRRAAAPVMRAEAERTREHGAAIAAQTRRLEEAGYEAQVAVTEEASNLMLVDEHGRDRLLRTERGWLTRREHTALPEAQLLRRIDAEPDSFSPNVMLRPVVENAIFPTIAYVAGPGELSYFAQLGCLFAAHGILPPVVVARPSITVIDERTSRKLERLGLDADVFARPFAELVADTVAAATPPAVVHAIESVRSSLKERYEALAQAAEEVDPTLRGPLIAARNRALLETNDVEKKVAARVRRRSAERIEQLRRLASALQPDGAPQERVFGPLPLIAEHGPDLVARMAEAIDMDGPVAASWSGPQCR